MNCSARRCTLATDADAPAVLPAFSVAPVFPARRLMRVQRHSFIPALVLIALFGVEGGAFGQRPSNNPVSRPPGDDRQGGCPSPSAGKQTVAVRGEVEKPGDFVFARP